MKNKDLANDKNGYGLVQFFSMPIFLQSMAIYTWRTCLSTIGWNWVSYFCRQIDICPLFAKGHLYFHNGTSTIWRIDISYLWAPEPLSSALFSFCHQMVNFAIFNLLSGKHNYGKSPCSMGKSTINHNFQWVNPLLITIFNSYVSHYQRVPVHLCHVGQSLHLERVPRCPGFVYVNDHGPIHRDCSNSQGLGTQHHSLKMGYTLKYPQHFTFQQGK